MESALPVPGAYENSLEPTNVDEGYVSASVNDLSSGSYSSNNGSWFTNVFCCDSFHTLSAV